MVVYVEDGLSSADTEKAETGAARQRGEGERSNWKDWRMDCSREASDYLRRNRLAEKDARVRVMTEQADGKVASAAGTLYTRQQSAAQ